MLEKVIDLRSDTVTKPTPAMRRAMAEAEVGDDVYGEDPTVNRLEARAAQIFGKEAALFVPSGTMGNTIAIKLHTRHGEEIICEARSHVYNYELAMMAWFSGCVARPIPSEDGILHWEQIRREIRPLGPHWAPTGLIVLENTHNMAGGTVYPPKLFDEICHEAHELGLKVHLDGARIFNAATFLGLSVRELTAAADTVMFCLSKGLGAPVGSVLVGSAALVDKARRWRKVAGGGWRQAGMLAAACMHALDHHVERLADDHERAGRLADGLRDIPGVELLGQHTNMAFVSVPAERLQALDAHLRQAHIRISIGYLPTLRLVTHLDVDDEGVARTLAAFRAFFD